MQNITPRRALRAGASTGGGALRRYARVQRIPAGACRDNASNVKRPGEPSNAWLVGTSSGARVAKAPAHLAAMRRVELNRVARRRRGDRAHRTRSAAPRAAALPPARRYGKCIDRGATCSRHMEVQRMVRVETRVTEQGGTGWRNAFALRASRHAGFVLVRWMASLQQPRRCSRQPPPEDDTIT